MHQKYVSIHFSKPILGADFYKAAGSPHHKFNFEQGVKL